PPPHAGLREDAAGGNGVIVRGFGVRDNHEEGTRPGADPVAERFPQLGGVQGLIRDHEVSAHGDHLRQRYPVMEQRPGPGRRRCIMSSAGRQANPVGRRQAAAPPANMLRKTLLLAILGKCVKRQLRQGDPRWQWARSGAAAPDAARWRRTAWTASPWPADEGLGGKRSSTLAWVGVRGSRVP